MATITKGGKKQERALNEKRKAPNVKRVIRDVDARALKQFLSGYIRFQPELNTAAKLLLGAQVGVAPGVDEIYGYINELWRKNRRKLDQEKTRKKFEFLLLSSVGVSADALSERNYRLAAAHNLAMHKWLTEVSEELHDKSWAAHLYKQVLEVMDGLLRSDMAPDLRDEYLAMLKKDYADVEAIPYVARDMWYGLYAAREIKTDEYIEALVGKFFSSAEPLGYLPAFLDQISLATDVQRRNMRKWVQRYSPEDIFVVFERLRIRVSGDGLFFVLSICGNWPEYRKAELRKYIDEKDAFLFDLHFARPEMPKGVWQKWIDKGSLTNHEEKLLVRYREQMSKDALTDFLLDQIIDSGENSLPQMEGWEWKDKLRLLPFIGKSKRRELLREFRSYCLRYAETHMGNQALEHISELGHILARMQYHREWSSIQESLQKSFGYRKSYRNW